jgi:hypothetical protein
MCTVQRTEAGNQLMLPTRVAQLTLTAPRDSHGNTCNVLSRERVAIDGVLIGIGFDSHSDTYSEDHCNHNIHKVFSGFTSRCFVAASNGEHSPSSGFLNHLRLQLPATLV